MNHPLTARLGAELLGTFLFFFLGFCGIAVVIESGAGAIGPLGIAAGFGFGLTLAITAFGHISGGHYNPAVTAALAAIGRFSWREIVPYWVAQLLGGACAVGTMAVVFGSDVTDALGTSPGPGTEEWGALILEAIVTGLLVMVILTVTTESGAAWQGLMTPFLIGLVIFTGATVLGPLTGGSFNPARSLVPAFYDGDDWGDLWIYLVGPIAGGMLGGAAWTYVCVRKPLQV
jgi:MIP family channel proteins